MKKLATILVFLTIAFTGYSQKDSTNKKGDTCICIKPQEMRNALMVADSLDIVNRELALTNSKLRETENALRKSDSTVEKQDRLTSIHLRMIGNYEGQVNSLSKSTALLLDEQSFLKSQIRKAKRTTLVIGGVSVAVIASLSYILIRQ